MEDKSRVVEDGFVPKQRIDDIRGAILQHLQTTHTFDEIRNIIDSYSADHPEFSPSSAQDVVSLLRERGIVQKVLAQLNDGHQRTTTTSRPTAQSLVPMRGLQRGVKYLHVRILKGRAFLDNLDLDPTVRKGQQMVVSLHFGGQRFRCAPQECAVDPTFDDDCLIQLTGVTDNGLALSSEWTGNPSSGLSALLDIATPLHIVVTKEECNMSRAVVMGENTVDWRRVLKTGFLSLTVELSGPNPGVPSGVMELTLEVVPSIADCRRTDEEIAAHVELQRSAVTAADREFLIYARRWWSEYQAVRPTHTERKVKVFAATSTGRMVPVTHFVSVLLPDRVLDSPNAASRFVSLLALTKEDDLTREVLNGGSAGASSNGNNNGDVWAPPFLFLCQRRGDICNHSTLLCSLLLGFGLDAYCAIGSLQDGSSHKFVLTRRRLLTSPQDMPQFEVLYWDPATGLRYQPSGVHPFLTVGSVFNHKSFYANTQPSDNAVTCRFHFDSESDWKALHPLKLRVVPRFPNPPLLWLPLNARAIEVDLEASLQRVVTEHRDASGIPTRWDPELALVLTQALTSYEMQRVEGKQQAELGWFQDCVRGLLGEGRTFRGVPLNVTHIGERKILGSWLASASAKEILDVVGDDLKLAVRVRCFVFPEGVLSVWVMLAASYRVSVS